MIIILFILTSMLLLVTLLPLCRSPHWWVRAWEFPRVHIIIAVLVLLVGVWIFVDVFWQQLILTTVLLGVTWYQLLWLYPYSKLVQPTVAVVPSVPQQDITCLTSNVEMSNDCYSAVRKLIEKEKPDVLFLMETDEAWCRALQPVLDTFTSVTSELKDNYYGIIFATNLPVEQINVHYVAGDDTPSIHATLCDKTGQQFIFRGVHPRPPLPGTTSKKRDEELQQTAEYARSNNIPEIMMGDFNDVIWSHNSAKLKRTSQYLDPQVGRSIIFSFHARYWFLRFPIDQFYVTKSVRLVSLVRGPNIGSDHFPLIAKLRFER